MRKLNRHGYRSMPAIPYTVSAFTHNGREVELVNGFLREEERLYMGDEQGLKGTGSASARASSSARVSSSL